jgi:hypothetical protein
MTRRPSSFLGKKVPAPTVAKPHLRKRHFSWIIGIAGPMVVIGSWAYLGLQRTSQQRQPLDRTVSAGSTRVLAEDPPVFTDPVTEQKNAIDKATGTTGYTNPDSTTAATAAIPDPCNKAYVKDHFDPQVIFPLLPPSIIDNPAPVNANTAAGKTSPNSNTGTAFNDASKTSTTSSASATEICTPAYWNRTILIVMAWKVLALLYWVAGVLAVIITIYAGLLYMSGFVSEENVKLAKKLLIACYTGVIIIIFGRVILYGTIQPFTGSGLNVNNIGLPNDLFNSSANTH